MYGKLFDDNDRAGCSKLDFIDGLCIEFEVVSMTSLDGDKGYSDMVRIDLASTDMALFGRFIPFTGKN